MSPARFLLTFVIFALFTIYYLSFIISPSHAQGYNQPSAPYANTDVPNNLHNWTQSVFIEVLSAATCQLMGIDPVSPNRQCLGADPKTGAIGFVEKGNGAVGMMGNLIASLYTPPLHSYEFTHYLASNFGIAKKAYAANGLGYNQLTPLLKLWLVFRNIAYLLFIIVFLVIGVAIMLRIKIDPRTVMSIENQLPKIIIGLIAVTFSYAIAGFLIDLMYVFTYLIFNIFTNPDMFARSGEYMQKISNTQRTFNGDNPFGLFNNLVGFQELVTNAAGGVKDLVTNLLWETKPPQSQGAISNLISVVFDTTRNIVGWTLGLVAGFLALLIIGAAVLWALFRLWFTLLQAYIFFLVDVVLAPFWIIGGLFPGSPLGLGPWIREMLTRLTAFPVTIAIFLMGAVFIDNFKAAGSEFFVPPLIGNPGDPKAFSSLIALGIILLAPQVVNMMQDLFKPPAFKYTAAIGEAMRAGASPITAGAGYAAGRLTMRHNLQTGEGEGGLRMFARKVIAGNQGPGGKRFRFAQALLGGGSVGALRGDVERQRIAQQVRQGQMTPEQAETLPPVRWPWQWFRPRQQTQPPQQPPAGQTPPAE